MVPDLRGPQQHRLDLAAARGAAAGILTKAAAYSITQALAQELAPHNVRVLSVHPGPVRTEMLPERLRALAAAPSAVAEDVVRALADGTPLHVFPDPHSKQLATIMQPFLTKVVEGGDVYNRGE